MKVIGIVGGMGVGKTTVVSMMSELKKTFVISADQIGHDLLLKDGAAYKKVIHTFGDSIVSENGDIIRAKLGSIVFKDQEKLKLLNNIMHPLIFNEVNRQIKWCEHQQYFEMVIIDAALLIEIGLVQLTDFIIAVYAEDEMRIKRVMERQGLSREQVIARFRAQKKWEEFSSIAHQIIDNSSSEEYTKEQIRQLIVHL